MNIIKELHSDEEIKTQTQEISNPAEVMEEEKSVKTTRSVRSNILENSNRVHTQRQNSAAQDSIVVEDHEDQSKSEIDKGFNIENNAYSNSQGLSSNNDKNKVSVSEYTN